MNTRRKSKAKVAVASQPEAESSQGDATALLSFILPADIDVEALSNLLPGESLESPTQESLEKIYRTLLDQALQLDATTRQAEELAAEIEKKDVEVDQAYQDKENDKKEFESSVENVANELKAVKDERDELGMYRLCSLGAPCLFDYSDSKGCYPNAVIIAFYLFECVVLGAG